METTPVVPKRKAKKQLSPLAKAAGKNNFAKGRLASLRNCARSLCSDQINIPKHYRDQLISLYINFFSVLEAAIEQQRKHEYHMANKEKSKGVDKRLGI